MDVRQRDREGLPLEHGRAHRDFAVLQDEIIDLDLLLSRVPLLRFRLGAFFWCDGFTECRHVLLYLADVATGCAAFIGDRKSTRLNSSHLVISYAVFCLKKKKKR